MATLLPSDVGVVLISSPDGCVQCGCRLVTNCITG
jgi:hypothetical protein